MEDALPWSRPGQQRPLIAGWSNIEHVPPAPPPSRTTSQMATPMATPLTTPMASPARVPPKASSATRGRHMVEWTPPAGRATRAELAVTVGLLRNALHGWHRLAVQHRLPLPPLRARVLSRAVRRWSASADRELQQGVMMGAAQYKSRRAHIAWAWWLIRLETSTDATAVLERVAEAAGTAIAAASAAATAVAAIGHGGGPA